MISASVLLVLVLSTIAPSSVVARRERGLLRRADDQTALGSYSSSLRLITSLTYGITALNPSQVQPGLAKTGQEAAAAPEPSQGKRPNICMYHMILIQRLSSSCLFHLCQQLYQLLFDTEDGYHQWNTDQDRLLQSDHCASKNIPIFQRHTI